MVHKLSEKCGIYFLVEVRGRNQKDKSSDVTKANRQSPLDTWLEGNWERERRNEWVSVSETGEGLSRMVLQSRTREEQANYSCAVVGVM